MVQWEVIRNVAPAPLDMLLFYIFFFFNFYLFTYVFAESGLSCGTRDLHCGAQTA